MNKSIFTLILVFFLLKGAGVLYSQQTAEYLVPRQIFVGDPATLVVPLPASLQNDTIIISKSTDANLLPYDPAIDFHRIILEKRTTGTRLLIEFTAFVPGTLELPDIEIGGEYFTALSFTVNSLIDKGNMPVLSGAAAVLAMPGTGLMLYGLMAALIIFVLLIIWFIIKGRTVLHELQKKWKHHRLFISMRNTEKRLQKALIKGTDKRLILDKLSIDFREFLSILTGNNCRSMTAREITNVFTTFSSPPGEFFCKLDGLRFSGENITSKDIVKLLGDLRSFLATLENDKKSKSGGK